MKHPLLPLVLLAAALMFTTGCSDDSNGPSNTGRLVINLTDAPAEYQQVNITFSEISAHIDSEWVTVRSAPITVDLLQWNNGQSIVIGDAELRAGKYTQIRLLIENAVIVVDGKQIGMDLSSLDVTGLKLIHNFELSAGSTYELVVDFDAAHSIVKIGPPANPTGYKLKPVLRVVPKAITGSISGTVSNAADNPVASARDASNAFVTSTYVNTSTGLFRLSYLSPGSYTVNITDDAGKQVELKDIVVTAGANTDIGVVTLQ